MAKKVSAAIIGGFVVSAIALFVGGILIFGSGSFFKQQERFILFFDEAVTGLTVGSPVKFRGVVIGSVKSIILLADPEKLQVDIPIIIEVDPAKFQLKKKKKRSMAERIDTLIELGLRAKLDLQSIVTGQLFVQLDFLPDTPIHLTGYESEYPEIPTIKSSWRELTEIIEEIPITVTSQNIRDITQGIKNILDSGKIEKIINTLDATIISANQLSVDADKMVVNLDREVQAVSTEMKQAVAEVLVLLKQAAASFEQVSEQTSVLLTDLDGEVEPISAGLQATLASARDTLEQAESTLTTMDRFIEQSDTRTKLNKALDQIADAARSLKNLTSYLERHPEALLQGKKSQ